MVHFYLFGIKTSPHFFLFLLSKKKKNYFLHKKFQFLKKWYVDMVNIQTVQKDYMVAKYFPYQLNA